MNNQGIDKMNLSLDEIIKLNKMQKQQQNRARGGGSGRGRGRGGSTRGRDQGLRNQRSRVIIRGGRGLRGQRTRGSGRGGSGTGTVSTTEALRGQGQGARRRGGRGMRGVVGSRSGLRGGVSYWGRGRGRGQSQVMTSSSRGGANKRGPGNLRFRRGTQGSLRGQGRGSLAQGQGLVNRMPLNQKREIALQTLRRAKQTITRLDQQTARQNFVNTRRGLIQQQTEQQGPLQKNQGLYSSTMSLNSAKTVTRVISVRHLQGTQVTTFSPVTSQGQRGRRWRNKAHILAMNSGNKLIISIGNTTALSNTASEFAALPVSDPSSSTQQQQQQGFQRQPRRRLKRKNNSISVSSNTDSASDGSDLRAGASPEFSQQLMEMIPTVSTKYVFEKKAFSRANTSFSLSDRFSGSANESVLERKVFL